MFACVWSIGKREGKKMKGKESKRSEQEKEKEKEKEGKLERFKSRHYTLDSIQYTVDT